MAIMHPQDIENYNYVPSEKEFYLALKEQLPDKMQVFYSIRWFDTDEEDKRVDSECDFLIFDPSFGFLTIEVKGGIGMDVNDGKWMLDEYNEKFERSIRELKCSPYEQAEKSMRHFYNYFNEEYNQLFNGVYGFAVAFPRYSADSLGQYAPKDITIDIDDMSNLAARINQIFHYWKSQRNILISFSAEQRKKFIDTINKRISLSAAAGALIPIKAKEFAKIDFVQDSVLDILCHYHQVQILGGAGTGKTFIAMKKAIRDLSMDKNVLFVCCNTELSNFVRKKITYRPEHFTCCTFNELMIKTLGDKYKAEPKNSSGVHSSFDLLEDAQITEKYDSIIVDEAQDFDVDMGLSIRMFLRDNDKSDLYVFYDENQNVFSTVFEDAFAINSAPYVLRYNIRNTGCIYECAVDKTKLGKDTIANSLLGVAPEEATYSNKLQALKALTGIINRLTKKEFVSNKSIVILSNETYDNSILAGEKYIGSYEISFNDLDKIEENQICCKTVEQFKGLEADIVIYLNHRFVNIPNNDVKRCKEYVALTRARYYLYIMNINQKIMIGD